MEIGIANKQEFLKKVGYRKEELKFNTYEEAEEYFNNLPDKALILSVEFPKNSGEYKSLAFFKPDCTLKEQKDFEATLNEEIKDNTAFFPKPISKELLQILKNPNLLEQIDKELNKRVVGENEARKTIFMIANMRNVENLGKATDNLMINAPSGAGKDTLAEAVFDLIPDEEKEELIRTTPKVLAYTRNRKITPLTTWKKTALRLEDASNEVLNDDSFKVFSSASPNKINMGKIINKGKVIDIEIEGKPSIIMTTAEASPKEEQLRRYPICPLDEGINQTKEILKRQSECAKTGRAIDYDETIKNSLALLKRIKVKVSFADRLIGIFNPQNVIVRTHFLRFIDYIKSSCSLFQYQRRQDSEGYFIAEKQDYDVARMMLQKTTSNILMIPLDKTKRTILSLFEEQNLQKKSVEDLQDYEEIKKLNIDIEWLRRQLKWLTSKSFLTQDKEKRMDESGKIISKPVSIFSYNRMQKLEIPEWEELNKISSITTNIKNSSNSSNSSNNGLNELNELNEHKRDITTSTLKEPISSDSGINDTLSKKEIDFSELDKEFENG